MAVQVSSFKFKPGIVAIERANANKENLEPHRMQMSPIVESRPDRKKKVTRTHASKPKLDMRLGEGEKHLFSLVPTSHVLTCSNLSSLDRTCSHLFLLALTYSHLFSLVLTCSHLFSLVLICFHLFSLVLSFSHVPTCSHVDSLGLTRVHWVSYGLTRAHNGKGKEK